METKKYPLDLDIAKPLSFEITRGDVFLINAEEPPYLNIEYTPYGNIHAEVSQFINDKNNIILKNSEIVKSKIILNLPKKLHEFDIHVTDGSITASNVSGNIKLQLDKGEIKIDKSEGKLFAINFSGNIKIHDFTGFLDLNANLGSIKIIDWNKAMGSIITGNGEVLLSLKKISNNIKINSNKGNISIGLSKDSACTIIARATDIMNYIDSPLKGKNEGNIANINYLDGKNKIEAFSSNCKIIVAKSEDLKNISPDMEELLNDIESSFKESFKFFGKMLDTFSKKLSKSFNNAFSNMEDKKDKGNSPNEKMMILNMLKEGKITAEEAEKLLNALK
jgi:hypothetical protein